MLLLGYCALALTPDAFGQAETLPGVGLARATEPRSAEEDELPEGLAAGDWAGIRASYEAGRHEAHPVEGGYQARNPGQQWRTCFDGRGFTTRPDAGGWTWGLELERYGFSGSEACVTRPEHMSAEGGRVAYGWDATLEEWYVNDARGIEHGYTVHRRPVQDGESEAASLCFTLAVRGTLRPEVAADGHDVRFMDGQGAVVLTYTGLCVFDADGQELESGFERVGGGLRISIDERGARYPLTIDPVAQQAYLKASNSDADDLFAVSVAVSGDTVVVGAPWEDSSATGVNGNETDDSALQAGAAYVFVRSGASWSQQAYLKASNTDGDDRFGASVSVSGDTVVVGAHQEASNATGVNGIQGNNSVSQAGAAYVFVRSGTTWSQQAYLKASNTGAGDFFGLSVTVSRDTVVVGAPREDSSATGVNGSQSNDGAVQAGAAYVFARSGTSWSQQAYLKASNTDADDRFGGSVAVSGETAVVGARWERSSVTGVNGNQAENNASQAGAAYVYVRSGTSWSQEAYLKASNTDPGDRFGISLAVSGDTVVVGATREDSNATGVNGDQSDNSESASGAAYVFVRGGTSWSQQAYIKASNTEGGSPFGDFFGESVSVSGDTLVVGAWQDDSSATGVNGDESDNSAVAAGAAFVFDRRGTDWTQVAYLKASNTGADDRFGQPVCVSGDTVVVGAHLEDSNATGVNGNQGDDSAGSAGAAYVFFIADPSILTYCTGKTTSQGCVPFMTAGAGFPSVTDTNPFNIRGNDHALNEGGILIYSLKKSNLAFHGGKLCVKSPIVRTTAKIAKTKAAVACIGPASTGRLTTDFNNRIQGGFDPQLTSGQKVFTQWQQRDPTSTIGGFSDNLSNGIRFTILP